MIFSVCSLERNLIFLKIYIYKEEWKYSEWSLFLDYFIGIFLKFGILKRYKYIWGLGEVFYYIIKKYMWKVR